MDTIPYRVKAFLNGERIFDDIMNGVDPDSTRRLAQEHLMKNGWGWEIDDITFEIAPEDDDFPVG